MPRVILTGFGPFGDVTTNPSELAVRELARRGLGGADLVTEVLPVEFDRCVARMAELVERLRPDVVLATGLAERNELTLERVAVNLIDARIPDTAGAQPVDEPVVARGPAAHFTTLPVKAMADAVRAAGIPCGLSLSAGSHACNAVMYSALHHAHVGTRAGFAHLPPLGRLGVESAVVALSVALSTALATSTDLASPVGELW